MRLTRFMAAAVLASVAGPASAQEKVDNPEFANWSRFKVGTTVTLVSTSENLDTGEITIVTTSTTLMEVAKERIVVEAYSISEGKGRVTVKTKPNAREILRTVQLPQGVGKEDFEKRLPGTIAEGTETLKIALGEFATRWYKTKVDIKGAKTERKTWICDDVPGRIVKIESKITHPKYSYTSKTELSEIKWP